MISLIYGGSSSGKSAFAEKRLATFAGSKYYLATMQVYDSEGQARVNKHRQAREGKGFITLECQRDIGRLSDFGPKGVESSLLLECMSNLVANEMFRDHKIYSADEIADKIKEDLLRLYESLDNLVIVSNNVFEDGIKYDEASTEYLKALGLINRSLAQIADEVYEVVVGIPIKLK